MIKELNLQVPADEIHNETFLRERVAQLIGHKKFGHLEVLKRSIDARQRTIKYNLRLAVYVDEEFVEEGPTFFPNDVKNAPEVHIIGAGPAGLFAALQALESGLKPIVFERGKKVRDRRRDLARITKEQIVDEDSNYCFGEGGAGTYSDGKLYTRSKKRGDVQQILKWLIHFGADKDIKVDAHPHIGTNKLPKIIESIREEIIRWGGEVRFESKLTDLFVEDGQIKGIEINSNEQYNCEHLILATGHSARDIFYLLNNKGITIESKPFAMGVRIEHSQELIDQIQYHGRTNDEVLPPAAYSLVTQVNGTGVYSFCMCPGGIIAPCATSQNEVVTNGWSPSKRNNPYSNSGIVVQLEPEELGDPSDPFVCLNFQKEVEKQCWIAAGKTQQVPAQRLVDFIEGRVSKDLPKTSYQAGIVSVDLNKVLPDEISLRLKQAFLDFGKKMKGYLDPNAVLHAPESRTSSPVKVSRNKEDMQHVDLAGLYPVGEGAGYAGGIVSAAIDGMNAMKHIQEKRGGK